MTLLCWKDANLHQKDSEQHLFDKHK